ncbi:MAG: 2-amino-4-hydroxy-6-hydroxymethyldihydropteridine diphosphokinase [Ancrocorticia sp.]
MTDTIRIEGVSALGCHGVLAEERTYDQPFVVDIELEVDTALPAATDDVAHTISYADVAQDAVAVITGESVNLIETLANRIAAKVLERDPLSVAVTIHKPEAPVGLPFSDVFVTVRRNGPLLDSDAGIRHVVLALGANLGEPRENLEWAIAQIKKLDVHVDAVSDFFETEPVLAPGQAAQPNYTNAVLTLDTALSPLELLRELQRIEVRGGRVRHERWGARLLDIDIVDFEGVTSAAPRLTLPHPRAAERLFVLEPWASIEPEAVLGEVPVSQLVRDLRGEDNAAGDGSVVGDAVVGPAASKNTREGQR